ncbi:MAG: DinB family protein [Balneolaceae bacterium]|nr:DinB family protein [Balneolaceae bacterium]
MEFTDQLKENTAELLAEVQGVPEDIFNTQPAEGEWSIANVVEHMYRSEYGIAKLLDGETKPLTDRDTDSKIDTIKKKLTNFETKVKASGAILPTEGEKSKDALLSSFKKNRTVITDLAKKKNPHELCLKFEHRFFGFLTRKEWIIFCVYHTRRHIHQIQHIKNRIS